MPSAAGAGAPTATLFPYATLFRSLVLDPVMVAKSGDSLLEKSAVGALIETLLPLTTMLTPNLPEAGVLLDRRPAATVREMRDAAEKDRKSTRLNSSHVKVSYAVCRGGRRTHRHTLSLRDALPISGARSGDGGQERRQSAGKVGSRRLDRNPVAVDHHAHAQPARSRCVAGSAAGGDGARNAGCGRKAARTHGHPRASLGAAQGRPLAWRLRDRSSA